MNNIHSISGLRKRSACAYKGESTRAREIAMKRGVLLLIGTLLLMVAFPVSSLAGEYDGYGIPIGNCTPKTVWPAGWEGTSGEQHNYGNMYFFSMAYNICEGAEDCWYWYGEHAYYYKYVCTECWCTPYFFYFGPCFRCYKLDFQDSPDLCDPAVNDWDEDGVPDAEDDEHMPYPAPPDMAPGGPEDKPNTEYLEVERSLRGCEKAGMPKLMVNLVNLSFVLEDKDLSYSGLGPPMEIVRYYNSTSTYNGIFGRGWTCNYGIHLQEEPSGDVVITRGSGAEQRFTYLGDGSYDPPKAIYDQLTKNPDGTFSLWLKRQRLTYWFDEHGVLSAVSDSNGNTLMLTYDASGLLTAITDAAGRTTSFTYDANGKVTAITDPLGRQVTFSYDDRGNLLESTDLADITTTYAYDGQNDLTSITTAQGTTTLSYLHPVWGTRLESITDAQGNTTEYLWEGVAKVRDARGDEHIYGNNSDGYSTYISDPLGNSTAFAYDDHGNRTSITNANGATTTLSYDDRGNITSITDALNNTTAFSYDDRDTLAQVIDPIGRAYRYTYDEHDNLIQVTDPLNHQSAFSYDEKGQLISITDPKANTSTFTYDEYGNLISMTDPPGNTATYTYNLMGKLLSATDPLGHTTSYEYDHLGRLTRIIHPDGSEVSYQRYCCGLAGKTDENGRTTYYDHNPVNLLVKVTDPLGNETSYEYDPTGTLTRITDPLGQETTFGYDAANHLTQTSFPEGTLERYTYDAVGNIISKTDGNGTVTNYTYDALGRLTIVAGPDLNITYTYNAVGNLTSMNDVTGTTAYVYDELNRLSEITYPNGQIVGYNYDGVGNITGITTPFGTVTYSYGVNNRLGSITLPNGQQVSYTYDEAGNVVRVDYPNGTYATYAYDTRNRLLNLTNYGPGEMIISRYTYSLDDVGNRTGVDISEPLSPSFTPQTINYSYAPGNILTSANGTTYDYDANGNLVEKITGASATNYTYDTLARLVEVDTGSQVYQYHYNGLGHRVARVVDGTQTNFLVDPNGMFPQVLAETDENNNLTAFYVYDGTGLVAMVSPGGQNYFYHYDGLGSTIAITNGNGELVNAYAYSPYGSIAASQESIPNPFKYVGKYGVMDEGNGLYFMRARYYDPEAGRFIAKEPIWFARGDVNLYVYCLNSPIKWIDPFGLHPILGAYRDPNKLGFYRNDPIVYQRTKMSFSSGWVGILTPEHGLLATVATGQLVEGSTRIVVYGENLMPSSWQFGIWYKTGEKDPSTGLELYGWIILSEEQALQYPVTEETIRYFLFPSQCDKAFEQ